MTSPLSPRRPDEVGDAWPVGLLGFLTVVLGGLLAWDIGRDALWLDEAVAANAGTGPWSGLWFLFRSFPEQHPVYYVLLHGWSRVFGSSDGALRAFSAVTVLVLPWAVYGLARALAGPRVARVAAAVAALSPFTIYLGQELRMYALMAVLATLNAWAFIDWTRSSTPGRTARYLASALAALYTHFFFLFALFGQFCWALTRWRTDPALTRRIIAGQLALGVAYLPWMYMLTHRTTAPSQYWKDGANVLFVVPYTVLRFALGYSVVYINEGWRQHILALTRAESAVLVPTAVAIGLFLVAGVAHLWRRGADGRFGVAGLMIPALTSMAVAVVVILTGERYLVVSYGFFCVAVGAGIVAVQKLRPRLALALTLAYVASITVSLWNYHFDPAYGREQWHDVADLLGRESRPGDVIVVHDGATTQSLERYYHASPGQAPVRWSRDVPADTAITGRIWFVLSHEPDQGAYRREIMGDRVTLRHIDYPKQSGIHVYELNGSRGSALTAR
jgi:4-amino-4-deoxy-L-arabinose transferase-like glycosyltransferase